MNKQAMVNALASFIGQRSGIDFRNYQGGDWKQSRECFLGDYRPILKYGRHARQLLRYVERSTITAEQLKEASRAYSGRLQFIECDDRVAVDYTTGQYFPTEYRAAACAVLAQCIWDHWRTSVADIPKAARLEFGRGIASIWFK